MITYPCWDQSWSVLVKRGPKYRAVDWLTCWQIHTSDDVNRWDFFYINKYFKSIINREYFAMTCRQLSQFGPKMAFYYEKSIKSKGNLKVGTGITRSQLSNISYMSQIHAGLFMVYRFIDARWLNSLRPRQNGRRFPDDIFKCIFLNENAWISLKISLKFVPKVRIDNIPALVQIMAWHRPGDKPLSEPMMAQFNEAYMRHSASMS